jgi:hypothetical protein
VCVGTTLYCSADCLPWDESVRSGRDGHAVARSRISEGCHIPQLAWTLYLEPCACQHYLGVGSPTVSRVQTVDFEDQSMYFRGADQELMVVEISLLIKN